MKLRINIGSGQRPFSHDSDPPWVNVDIQRRWKPDVVADAGHMPMFGDASADMIVSHHCAEHVGCGENAAMLNECRRILVPGGSLLIFVPDMLALAHAWIEGRIDDQIYFTNVYGAYMNDESDRHRWGYASWSLSKLLNDHGFKPMPFDWRPIPGAEISKDWWILGMEAIR